MSALTERKNSHLFNEGTKRRFLSGISNEGTRNSYERIFRSISDDEIMLNKDVGSFSTEEISTLLKGFKANNRNTIESYGRIISSYLNWSVEQGLIKINVLKKFKPTDFEKFIVNNENYITEKQLRRYEDLCENYQDAVILRMLFSGIGGKQLSEIRNLKKNKEHIVGNKLKLINTLKYDDSGKPSKYTERYFDLGEDSDRILTLLYGAINETIYYKKNGQISEDANNVRRYTDLVDNEYVIRSSITKTDNLHSPVDKFVIYRRIAMLSDVFGADGLTTKLIQRSGMIYFANKLLNGKDEELSTDDLKIVADRFNVKSHHNLKGFLTLENIRKTYPKK